MPGPVFKNYSQMSVDALQEQVGRLGFSNQKESLQAATQILMNPQFSDNSCKDSVALLLDLSRHSDDRLSMVVAFIAKVRPDIEITREQMISTPLTDLASFTTGVRGSLPRL